MSYQVLARRWRPLTFDAVVGQAPVVRTLKNALAQERIAHAYLFAGPVSGGSMNPARSLAPALLTGRLEGLWLYLLAPPAGAALGVLVCRTVHGRPCCRAPQKGPASLNPTTSPARPARRSAKAERATFPRRSHVRARLRHGE